MSNSIIFGADVTHPSPEQTSIPSVAAVSIYFNIIIDLDMIETYYLPK